MLLVNELNGKLTNFSTHSRNESILIVQRVLCEAVKSLLSMSPMGSFFSLLLPNFFVLINCATSSASPSKEQLSKTESIANCDDKILCREDWQIFILGHQDKKVVKFVKKTIVYFWLLTMARLNESQERRRNEAIFAVSLCFVALLSAKTGERVVNWNLKSYLTI